MITVLDNPQQPFVSRFFKSALAANHLANTFVLLSSDARIAMAYVQRLAQVLNCHEAGVDDACGQCQNCLWILNNAHPAFTTLSNWNLDKKKIGKTISVESFSDVLSDLLRHSGGVKRVVLLVGCAESDTAQPEAYSALWPTPIREQSAGKLIPAPLNTEIMAAPISNKLLKTLEEAPRDTYFFLITDSERKLFETILSRAQIIRFRPQAAEKDEATPVVERGALRNIFKTAESSQNTPALSLIQFRQWVLETAEAEGVDSDQLLEHFTTEARTMIPEIVQQGPAAFKRFCSQLQSVRRASEQIRQYVREDAVLEHLALDLT